MDRPKPGGSGTTNDGTRKAFEKPDLLAEYLDFNPKLLCNFKTILIALSCHLPKDPQKFQTLCDTTAELYVKSYNWFPMPSTLYKILMHGADIIRTSLLPVGMLVEEASESRNKDYKNYRLSHCRTFNRKANIEDMFYRAMDSSDPIICSINLQSRNKKKVLKLTQEVRNLLVIPQENKTCNSNIESDNGES